MNASNGSHHASMWRVGGAIKGSRNRVSIWSSVNRRARYRAGPPTSLTRGAGAIEREGMRKEIDLG